MDERIISVCKKKNFNNAKILRNEIYNNKYYLEKFYVISYRKKFYEFTKWMLKQDKFNKIFVNSLVFECCFNKNKLFLKFILTNFKGKLKIESINILLKEDNLEFLLYLIKYFKYEERIIFSKASYYNSKKIMLFYINNYKNNINLSSLFSNGNMKILTKNEFFYITKNINYKDIENSIINSKIEVIKWIWKKNKQIFNINYKQILYFSLFSYNIFKFIFQKYYKSLYYIEIVTLFKNSTCIINYNKKVINYIYGYLKKNVIDNELFINVCKLGNIEIAKFFYKKNKKLDLENIFIILRKLIPNCKKESNNILLQQNRFSIIEWICSINKKFIIVVENKIYKFYIKKDYNNIIYSMNETYDECPICFEKKKLLLYSCNHFICIHCFNIIYKLNINNICHICRRTIKELYN